jgi:hypothetical protein
MFTGILKRIIRLLEPVGSEVRRRPGASRGPPPDDDTPRPVDRAGATAAGCTML